MLKALSAVAVLTLAAFSVPTLACDGHDSGMTAEQKVEPKKMTVAELKQQMASAKKNKTTLAIFDANSQTTRDKQGVIPTAVLLQSSKDYDTAVLPKDKAAPVVFYCASDRCSASDKAAKRAIEAGHTDVAVLPDGIAGWVKAGQPVTKPVS